MESDQMESGKSEWNQMELYLIKWNYMKLGRISYSGIVSNLVK